MIKKIHDQNDGSRKKEPQEEGEKSLRESSKDFVNSSSSNKSFLEDSSSGNSGPDRMINNQSADLNVPKLIVDDVHE